MRIDQWLPSGVRWVALRYELQIVVSLPFVVFFGLLLPAELLARSIAGQASTTGTSWQWMALTIPTLAFCAGYVASMWLMVGQVQKVGWRRLLELQRNGADIRALPWRQFEAFVAAAFAQQGWTPEVVGKAAPDGGIDIRLRRKKEKAVVQCKQRRWEHGFVGEKDVREFVGVITAEKAARGFFVTSGVFSPEAVEFAARVPKIELVAADDLFRMLGRCPDCGSEMILKNGRRGPFMSCVTYPDCRGSADLPTAA